MSVTISGSGQIIKQVIQVVKTDAFSSSTQSTFLDVTGMSASITPTNASNKILVTVNLGVTGMSVPSLFLSARIIRNGSTIITQGDGVGSATRISFAGSLISGQDNNGAGFSSSFTFLDSPATTSPTTYNLQLANINNTVGGTWYLNRTSNTGSSYNSSGVSTITLMEVAYA